MIDLFELKFKMQIESSVFFWGFVVFFPHTGHFNFQCRPCTHVHYSCSCTHVSKSLPSFFLDWGEEKWKWYPRGWPSSKPTEKKVRAIPLHRPLFHQASSQGKHNWPNGLNWVAGKAEREEAPVAQLKLKRLAADRLWEWTRQSIFDTIFLDENRDSVKFIGGPVAKERLYSFGEEDETRMAWFILSSQSREEHAKLLTFDWFLFDLNRLSWNSCFDEVFPWDLILF